MKKYTIIGFGILACIVGFLFYFRVSSISCTLQGEDCPLVLQEKLSRLKGVSLFFTHFEPAVTESISDETILVATIKKQLPNTLVLELQQEKPQYILQTAEKKYTVFSSGVVHELAEGTTHNEYHIFHLEFPIEKSMENSYVLPNYHEALTALSLSLYNSPFSLQNSTWKDAQTVQFTLPSGVGVFMPIESAEEKIEVLKLILDSPELDTLEEPLTEIDLRYKYPVLRTTQ